MKNNKKYKKIIYIITQLVLIGLVPVSIFVAPVLTPALIAISITPTAYITLAHLSKNELDISEKTQQSKLTAKEKKIEKLAKMIDKANVQLFNLNEAANADGNSNPNKIKRINLKREALNKKIEDLQNSLLILQQQEIIRLHQQTDKASKNKKKQKEKKLNTPEIIKPEIILQDYLMEIKPQIDLHFDATAAINSCEEALKKCNLLLSKITEDINKRIENGEIPNKSAYEDLKKHREIISKLHEELERKKNEVLIALSKGEKVDEQLENEILILADKIRSETFALSTCIISFSPSK